MSTPLDIPTTGNFLGTLALTAYVTTLLPTTLRIVFPVCKTSQLLKLLLKNRRGLGILSFILAAGHAYCVIRKRNFDFFDLNTYVASFEGSITFLIFTLLTITSNDWSIKKLKRNWKRLHTLTYWAMALLVWHVISKMAGQWTIATPFAVAAIFSMTALFLVRQYLESENTLRHKTDQPRYPSR